MKKNINEIIDDIKDRIIESVKYQINMETYLGTILFFSPRVHKLHLLTKSYSQHKALESLYENIIEISDEIIENSMAIYEIDNLIDIGDDLNYSSNDCIKYIVAMKKFIIEYRNKLFDENLNSNIYSNIDDLLSEIDRCLYRLKNLD